MIWSSTQVQVNSQVAQADEKKKKKSFDYFPPCVSFSSLEDINNHSRVALVWHIKHLGKNMKASLYASQL